MSGRRGGTDSPHHGGQAVAKAESIPRSTSPKLSPITPVHKPRELRSEIVMSAFEAREFAEFKNQPKGLQFRHLGKESNAGVYKKRENKTIKYNPNAYLFSVQLSDR